MVSFRFEKLSPRILLHADGADLEFHDELIPQTADVAPPLGTLSPEQFDTSTPMIAETPADHGTPHPGDLVRSGEHQALLNLVPHEQVTHRAIIDGPWSDSATWEFGELPADRAHVLIPADITVVVDDQFEARLATIRVDGLLHFSTDVNTSLHVDTFVVAVEGTLTIGTSEQPILPDVTARVLFTDDGPIDTDWDPTLLSRGLISHGSASIFGAAKSGPIDLATAPVAGDTVLELASAAEGWQVGDRILVPGVVRPAENNKGKTLLDEDEIVVITAISDDGHFLEIDQPLAYHHVPPQAQLTLPVANLDRNIQFSSENTTDPQRAGHVMFIHSANATVNYAAFRHIGRNDKSLVSTDPQLDEDGKLIPSTGLNARGRYAVHFHRIGSEKEAATVTGSVVENNPGWGFVNHDSNVEFRENVSYDVKGAGFVAEIGSERGAFINNMAVRSRGKNYYQPQGPSDKGTGTGFGSVGHGFWLQSASVALIDNVAAGHAQEGIFIHNRLVTEAGRDLPAYASLIDVPAGTPLEFAPGAAEPSIRDGLIRADQAPLAEVRGNKVFASGAGLGVRWRRNHTSALAEGDEGDVIEDFEIWNVRWAGIHLGYVTGLTFRNGLILGDVDDPLALSKREQQSRDTETTEYHSAYGKGIAANRNSRNLTFENLEIAGFTVGIQVLTAGHTRIDSVQLQNIENLLVVTPQATSLSDNMRRIEASNIVNVPLTPEALAGQTPYNVRLLKQFDRAPTAGGSTASHEWSAFTASDEIYYNGHRLYFYEQALEAIPFSSSTAPDFMFEPAYAKYLDLTNQQLLNQFGFALGNEVTPTDSFDALDEFDVAALAVELDETPPAPQRVEFRFDKTESPSTWTLNDTDLRLAWQTKGLSEDTEWRVYLNGEEGTQEIARSGFPSNSGFVVSGNTTDAWQNWELQWATVGRLPSFLNGNVAAGDYSLIAVADRSPAVYLGQIVIVDEASLALETPLIPVADPVTESTETVPAETVVDDSDRIAALDEALTAQELLTNQEPNALVSWGIELEEPEELEETEEQQSDVLSLLARDQLFVLDLLPRQVDGGIEL